MDKRVLVIEGESIEEVRAEALAKTPPGLAILSETVLASGSPNMIGGLGETADEAAARARREVPPDTKIIWERLRDAAERKILEVQAWDRSSAEEKVKKKINHTCRIERIEMTAAGRKGVFGIGKTPNTYSAAVFQPAVYDVAFQGRARIRVEIGERTHAPSGYCQLCGIEAAPAKAGDKNIHYFCSSQCEESYFKAKLATLMFSRDAFIFNASGQDISGQVESGRAWATCWSCGDKILMTAKKCVSCGKEQDIPA